MQTARWSRIKAVSLARGDAVRDLVPPAAARRAACIAACVASTWHAAPTAASASARRRVCTTAPARTHTSPAPAASPHAGFTASADGCTLVSAAPVAGHALTVTLPDDLEGWMDLTGADTGYAGQVLPDAAPGNKAHPVAAAAGAPAAAAESDAPPLRRPRIDVVLETGWRDGLEVQLLQMLPADGGSDDAVVGAACAARPAGDAATAGGGSVLVPLKLSGADGPVAATASPDDSVVDVAVSHALLRFIQTQSHHPHPPRLLLLLRAPTMLDVTVSCGAAVAADVTLRGKLEGDVAVSAPRGGVTVDKVRGTSVMLVTAPAGALRVGALLETGTATLRCGSFAGAKVLGERVALTARSGPVTVDAAYVRQLEVDVQAPTDDALAAAAATAGTPSSAAAPGAGATAAIRVGTLHGSARLSASHGGIDVGGLTGALDATAPAGSVRLHVDAAKGRVRVACGGVADVTLLPPQADLPLALSSALPGPGGVTVVDAPSPPSASMGGRGRGSSGRDSGKINSGLPVGGFYDSAPSVTSCSNNGASASGTTSNGSRVVHRMLVAQPPAQPQAASVPSSPAAAVAADAGAPRLEVDAGGAVTVAVLDWVSLMQRRMGAKTAHAARAGGAAVTGSGSRRGASAATA